MSGRMKRAAGAGAVFAVALIAAAVAAWLTASHYSRLSFELLNAVCGEVVEQEAGSRSIIAAALKEYTSGNPDGCPNGDVLPALGYRPSDFSDFQYKRSARFALGGALIGIALFACTFLLRNAQERRRIGDIVSYLEKVNSGRAPILSAVGEDDFSKLEDEIYKTVTSLYQLKDQAVRSKNDFAENLSNIAHQIKTPITALSLAAQRMKRGSDPQALTQMEKQLTRLTSLEDSLLLLSRLDAGVLLLRREATDVFTLLELAADNLTELFTASGTSVDIPEQGEMRIDVDMDWTMEAVMNLMKNCIEHDPGDCVHCRCAQNPLYVEIRIWDEGKGFEREDLPHIFERFYRGKNAREGGIGIGLALAKELIERQNGTIWAKNRAGGGAEFEIRFYSH